MKKYLLLLCCLIPLICFSQKYTTAFGARILGDYGATLQQRILDKYTIEVIGQSNFNNRSSFMALFEVHQKLFFVRSVNAYAGAGPHIGWETSDGGTKYNPVGLTFIGGLEVTFFKRLNLSWDFKPQINITESAKRVRFQTGVSIRAVMVKRKTNILGINRDKQKRKRKKRKRQKEKAKNKKKKNGQDDKWDWLPWKKKKY